MDDDAEYEQVLREWRERDWANALKLAHRDQLERAERAGVL